MEQTLEREEYNRVNRTVQDIIDQQYFITDSNRTETAMPNIPYVPRGQGWAEQRYIEQSLEVERTNEMERKTMEYLAASEEEEYRHCLTLSNMPNNNSAVLNQNDGEHAIEVSLEEYVRPRREEEREEERREEDREEQSINHAIEESLFMHVKTSEIDYLEAMEEENNLKRAIEESLRI